MTQPKVSIIIPVYNTAPYLLESVGSVMNQTLKDIQIIIINDGSTDGSIDIIRKLADKDNRIEIYEQENQGLSCARNTGMKYVKGEYTYFMDSDDILILDTLEVCYNRCKKDKLQFVFFDSNIIYEEGAPKTSWNYHRTELFDEDVCYNGILLFNKMLDTWTHRAVVWLLFINSEHIKKTGISFYPKIIHEDELFTTLLYLNSNNIGCIKRSFVKHRIRANSIMTKGFSKRNVDCYLIVAKQLKKYDKKTNDIEKRILINKYLEYTLNKVFDTASSLSHCTKYKILLSCMTDNWLRYVKFKTICKFIIK